MSKIMQIFRCCDLQPNIRFLRSFCGSKAGRSTSC